MPKEPITHLDDEIEAELDKQHEIHGDDPAPDSVHEDKLQKPKSGFDHGKKFEVKDNTDPKEDGR